MRQNNWKYRMQRGIAAFLSLILGMVFLSPALAFAKEAEDSTIHIQTQEDLKELAEYCRLDTWSQGKTVILDNDLTLDKSMDEFLPIPTFGGIFEGNGHTISGLSLDGENSRAGLFDTLQASAVVTRLTVVGQVSPAGEGDAIGGLAGKNFGKINRCSFEGTIRGAVSVGGLVGINEATGQMINCQFQGTVTGEHYVGGIAGQNAGSLVRCENYGEINTTAVEVSADFSDISMLRTTESVPAGTDIGGITGFSSGVIQNCENTGNVGYEHMGYNVGGIVGRQSGYLDGCQNTGTVNGRKDVGGIAGQLEPQVTLRYDQDLLDQLWIELDTLESVLDRMIADANSGSSTVSQSVEGLISDIGIAKDAANSLNDAIVSWGNENIGQINDLFARLSWVIHELEPILDESSNAAQILENASSLLVQAMKAVEETGEQGKASAVELKLVFEDLQDASAYAENCKNHLRCALEIAQQIINGGDDVIQSIQEELSAAHTDALNAKASLESAVTHGKNAKAELEAMGDQGGDALSLLTQAMDSLNQGMGSLETVLEPIASVLSTLAQNPAVSFTPVDSSVTSQGDALDNALAQVLNYASELQGSISSSSDALLSDFDAMNRQLQVILDLLQQQMEETQQKDAVDSFEDISDEDDSGEPASGKIHGAINSGEICGDVNVAGIVGSMSVEYDFDPEDDLTKDGTRSLDFQYRTLAVVTGCMNKGNISAKKDYSGGIVGRMDLGAVKTCESYGKVESLSGDYVGGIAGLSRATIRNCFVKCTLSGGDYVGGVVGAGEKNTVVSHCYTLVDIPDSGRYAGAVSGTEDGEFTGNYYVSDSLAGLGRISYSGKAEPLSFEDLTQVEDLPEEMTQFTLRFLVEDKEMKSESFSYGDSFGADVFPEIPVKDGYYASWDTDDLTDLHFDQTVTAEYERFILTLPSQATRKSGRPIFLMDGNFDEKATLNVSSVQDTEWIFGKNAEEQWSLTCSDSSQDHYTIRYLSPQESAEGYCVYVKQEGKWQKAESTIFGSYLVFSVSEAHVEVAIVPTDSMWLMWLLIGLGILVLLIILGLAVRARHSKEKKELSAQMAADGQSSSTPVFKGNAPKKLKKSWIWILAIVLAAIIAVAALVVIKFGSAVNAYELLQKFSDRPEYAMTLSLDIQLDDQLTDTDIKVTKTQVEGHTVTCIQNDGISLYYADGAVIMENGKAYQISDLYPDYSSLPVETAKIFQALSFTTSKSGGKVTCSLTAEGEDAKTLLSILVPKQLENISDTQKLTVQLTSLGDEFQSLHFSSEGTLVDDAKTPFTLSAELKPDEMDETFSVPEPVQKTVSTGTLDNETVISEDLFRLVTTWTDLSQQESLAADITLGVECNPISLNEQFQFERIIVEGEKIGCIRQNDHTVYFADGSFCDQYGTGLNAQDDDLAIRARLFEALYQLCLNGEFKCADTGNDTWIYTQTLDEDAMKKVSYAAAPEIENIPITLTSGSIQIMVKGTSILELDCICTGGLDSLAETDPVTVSVKLNFLHNSEAEIPVAVKTRLLQGKTAENGK